MSAVLDSNLILYKVDKHKINLKLYNHRPNSIYSIHKQCHSSLLEGLITDKISNTTWDSNSIKSNIITIKVNSPISINNSNLTWFQTFLISLYYLI